MFKELYRYYKLGKFVCKQNMKEKIKKYIYKKLTSSYIKDIEDVLPYIFKEEEKERLSDMLGDMKICEKVFDNYFMYFNI